MWSKAALQQLSQNKDQKRKNPIPLWVSYVDEQSSTAAMKDSEKPAAHRDPFRKSVCELLQ